MARSHDQHASVQNPLAFLAGGSEMAEHIRSFDWSKTPIGPVESWSSALRMMVRLLLANPHPILLWWGPQYIQIYNDTYAPILGAKHPWALGRLASECWKEIWHTIQPLIDKPFKGGSATWNEDLLVEPNRYGFLDEGHFTIGYSAVPDETALGGIGGVLATVHEITDKVVGERRVVALRDLSACAEARTAEEACATAAKALAPHDKDLPFVLLYLIAADGKWARLAGAAGVETGAEISPLTVELDQAKRGSWPMAQALQTEAIQIVEHLSDRFAAVPRGPWSDPPHTAAVVPVPSNKPHEPAALMVAGVSPRLKFDTFYRDFFGLVRTQIATAIANARAYEEERKRAEALAELDRAKTTFFSNVSHEFRTPLTLMLGPTEDLLRMRHGILPRAAHEHMAVVHRNALRLQKLVNALLDFSRIEAGRIQARYEPTDLPRLTADLASAFRSVVEKAGMRLLVDCPPLAEPIYVDRDMWEKVVLNLVSNAFKFTLEGEIEVKLWDAGETTQVSVRDTGAGIPEEQLAHLFERFHRVEGMQARTHEGTGIGLSLVQELVKLHGGTVRVESVRGKGSTFTVAIPKGKEHLPTDRIGTVRTLASTALTASHYLEEALRWLPDKAVSPHQDSPPAPPPAPQPPPVDTGIGQRRRATEGERPRILWADDNADMRDYVRRLLSERYEVDAIADGEAALAAVRCDLPDLVLADIMMPRLDGIGLLRALRADERTRTVPVILLSARAGEESRIEGLEAGADDYLIKPFSAKELLAHVGSHLELARLRRETAEALREAEVTVRASEVRYRRLFEAAKDGILILDTDNGKIIDANSFMSELLGYSHDEFLGKELWEIGLFRNIEASRAAYRELRQQGQIRYDHLPLKTKGGKSVDVEFISNVYREDHQAVIQCNIRDVTERKRLEKELQQYAADLSEADRHKNEFLAMLAHELRNPLAPIRNALQILRLTGGNGEAVQSASEMMERQVGQMVRLVDDLLDVSRISRGKIELRKGRVELASVVNHVVEAARLPCERKNLELMVSMRPNPVYVDGDPTRLAQVVGNLLNNACKFTDEGGRIWLTVEQEGEQAVIWVRDTGIGIATDQLSSIFDMFKQVDTSLERSVSGLGIGLTLVKELVEMHGGTVEARSAGIGQGSEFVVRLPIVVETAKLPPEPTVSEPMPTIARRILVVDDNRDSAESLAMLLELTANKVHTAHDGLEAVEAAETFKPDVVLLDIGLPKLNGYDVCGRIREQAWGKDMVLVALTGWGQEEDRQQSRDAGFNAHMVKPVDLDALMKLLASLPRKRSAS